MLLLDDFIRKCSPVILHKLICFFVSKLFLLWFVVWFILSPIWSPFKLNSMQTHHLKPLWVKLCSPLPCSEDPRIQRFVHPWYRANIFLPIDPANFYESMKKTRIKGLPMAYHPRCMPPEGGQYIWNGNLTRKLGIW